MLGYSPVQLYFMINMLYTIFMFFFLHNSIVEKVMTNYKKIHSKDLTNEEIQKIMNTFYIISVFLGSIKLLKDTLNLIFDHRSCLWLHWYYRKKEKK